MKSIKVKFKKLGKDATMPKRVTPGSAGLDLYASKKKTVPTNSTVLIDTDLAVEIPEGYVGIIKVNSGIAVRDNVTENAGVIDSDYRGHLKVAIANISADPLKVLKGDRIGQLLIVPCWVGDPEEVEELSSTERGEKGFGQASAS